MSCQRDHSSISHIMAALPDDQGGIGRHKCAACAYDAGFLQGRSLMGRTCGRGRVVRNYGQALRPH